MPSSSLSSVNREAELSAGGRSRRTGIDAQERGRWSPASGQLTPGTMASWALNILVWDVLRWGRGDRCWSRSLVQVWPDEQDGRTPGQSS